MLKKVRVSLAVLFFIGTTLLFLDFTGVIHCYLGWMAKVQLLPAILALNFAIVVGLVLLTLVAGRIYCSVICPLGVFQDAVAWFRKRLMPKAKRNGNYKFHNAHNSIRVGILMLFVVMMAFGLAGIATIIAPYSAYGRIAQTVLQPIYITANNGLAYLAEQAGSYAFYSADVWVRSLPVLIVGIATFVIVAVTAFFTGRDYCNTICPVGTLLGCISKYSYFKVLIDADKCKNCTKCEKSCKSHCIDLKTKTVDGSRCVTCGNCLNQCSFGAIKYGHAIATSASDNNVNEGRRSFLVGTALLGTTAALAQSEKKVDGGLAIIEDKVIPERQTAILPPGAVSAEHFAKHCTGCQLCVAECPNGVLRPGDSLLNFMQPVMSYERGYCRPECHRCAEVCPTGAIRLTDLADKVSTKVGTAHWIKKNCVPVADGQHCGNCARHCPAGAIDMVLLNPDDDERSGLRVPAVNEERCIGCGACENLCPSRPLSAIIVEGVDRQRKI